MLRVTRIVCTVLRITTPATIIPNWVRGGCSFCLTCYMQSQLGPPGHPHFLKSFEEVAIDRVLT